MLCCYVWFKLGNFLSASATYIVVTRMEPDTTCVLVLIQCRDREWHGDNEGNEARAFEAAQLCLRAGFAVLRVRTQNWSDVKAEKPNWFQPLFQQEHSKQEVICSINYIHFLCPALKKVHGVLQSCATAAVRTFLRDRQTQPQSPITRKRMGASRSRQRSSQSPGRSHRQPT